MVLIGPPRSIGNVTAERRGGQNLRQQWIRIQRDSRNQPLEFIRWIRRGPLRKCYRYYSKDGRGHKYSHFILSH
jgi:hypothetical protein